MSTVLSPPRYTPEDLLTMPDGDRYELVDGNLVDCSMSFWASYVTGEIHGTLRAYSKATPSGWVMPESTSYQCFPDAPEKVRKPDVSFIRRDRISLAEALAEGHCLVHPDLAIEVISPNDLAYKVEEKVDEYLAAGVSLVWVVYPLQRTVRVHRADGTVSQFGENDDLTGENVLPGFRCRVGQFFAAPPGTIEE